MMKSGLIQGLVSGAIGAMALVAAACSSSSSTPPDNDVNAFCADWAKAYCQVGACALPQASCQAYQTTVCLSTVNSAQSGTRVYSQPNGKACIDALNGAYGNNPTSISPATLAKVAATCERVVAGNQASDQSCVGDADCAQGLLCEPFVGSTSSVCSIVTTKNDGDICGDPGDQCPASDYCAPQTGAAPKCVVAPAVGSACSSTVLCGGNARCLNGTCQARALQGETCASNADCDPTASYCDLYPPAVCTSQGLTFARGSADCNGIGGTNPPVTVTPTDAGSTPVDSGAVAPPDSGAATDASGD